LILIEFLMVATEISMIVVELEQIHQVTDRRRVYRQVSSSRRS
jgi:hypothetical protein